MEDKFNLLIKDENGTLIDECFCNLKSVNKSIENKELWILDGKSYRVLPYEQECNFLTIDKIDSYTYCAIVSNKVTNKLSTSIKNTRNSEDLKKVKHSSIKFQENSIKNSNMDKNNSNSTIFQGGEKMDSNFLFELSKVINKRHLEMPKGSYTTYLFEKGDEKIRKKTGEEAIEVILAKDNKELISESADLVYHLMVLLENNGLSIEDVIQELKSRDS